jgi:hypothetical protein
MRDSVALLDLGFHIPLWVDEARVTRTHAI